MQVNALAAGAEQHCAMMRSPARAAARAAIAGFALTAAPADAEQRIPLDRRGHQEQRWDHGRQRHDAAEAAAGFLGLFLGLIGGLQEQGLAQPGCDPGAFYGWAQMRHPAHGYGFSYPSHWQQPQVDEPNIVQAVVNPCPPNTAIDVAPNGVTAVAALAGAVVVRESETKSAREIAQGTVVVIVPKKGVSPPVPLPAEARKNLVQMRREAEESRSIAQAPAGPRLSDATPARGVKDGRPVEPTTVFRADARELFVWFRLSGITGPTEIRSVWNYVAPDGDQFIVEAQATARPENQ